MAKKTTTKKATTKKTSSKSAPAEGSPGRVLKRKPRAATKKASAKKKAPGAKTNAPGAKPEAKHEFVAGSLQDLRIRFGVRLLALAKSEGTVRSYLADLAVACKHFGAERLVADLSEKDVAAFFTSERVTKGRNGQKKNQVTIDKVIRVFRQAIDHAQEIGWIKESPLPPKERRKAKKEAQA